MKISSNIVPSPNQALCLSLILIVAVPCIREIVNYCIAGFCEGNTIKKPFSTHSSSQQTGSQSRLPRTLSPNACHSAWYSAVSGYNGLVAARLGCIETLLNGRWICCLSKQCLVPKNSMWLAMFSASIRKFLFMEIYQCRID